MKTYKFIFKQLFFLTYLAMKTQIKQTIAKLSALAFVFATVIAVAPQSEAETDAVREVQINAEVVASLQLQVDSGSVLLEVDPDVNEGTNMTGGTATASGSITGGTIVPGDYTTTSVQTNNIDGYKLQIQLNGHSTTGSAVLDGANVANTTTIPAGDFSTENTFGFALESNTGSNVTAFTNSATDIDGSDYGQSTNNHDQDIYYYLNVDYTIPADTYQGKVTYTAVVLP